MYAQQLREAILSHHVVPQVPGEKNLQTNMVEKTLKAIATDFGEFMKKRRKNEASVIKHHSETLRSIGRDPDSNGITSLECCLFCLSGLPRQILECGHRMCDDCVRRFAHCRAGEESGFMVKACMICGTASLLRVQLKPVTAGVRILSLDGGGMRGVLTLQLLQNIQSALGSTVRVQDFFDVAFGVSAGESPLPRVGCRANSCRWDHRIRVVRKGLGCVAMH